MESYSDALERCDIIACESNGEEGKGEFGDNLATAYT